MDQAYKVRLNRLFSKSGRCLDIAIDHGVFNEYSFLDGLEDVEGVIESLVSAQPDAIQTNYGQSRVLQSIPGRDKPALVMRVDVGNVYNPVTHDYMFDTLQNSDEPILEALRMDAACVVVNLLLLPGQPELHAQSVRNISRLRGVCEKYGMPLMIEPLVRQARELGADIIKADPTDNPEDFHEVVQAARCPVLVRGGGKADLRDVLERSYLYLQQGAHGLMYGRNIYQHPNPTRIVRAFMAMIHEGATAKEAWELYREGEAVSTGV